MVHADGFGRLVMAEWVKLRSVRGWVLGMVAAATLTVGVGLLASAGSGTDINQYPDFVVGPTGEPVVDDFHFVHQPLSGDGTIVARVAGQQAIHERAAAGLMLKENTTSGSRYTAVMVTAAHAVRLTSNYTTDLAGTARPAPHWLRLTRSGDAVTADSSSDGTRWDEIGTVDVSGLPPTVEIGLFVTSPPAVEVERQFGSTSVGGRPTHNTAVFDNVRIDTGHAQPTKWVSEDIGKTDIPGGSVRQADGTFTVTGSGDIGPHSPPDDVVQISLFGVVVGLMAVVAVAALFVTSEHKRAMIRTTFAASPRRGRVLTAKALVMGGSAFLTGLAGSVAAFLLAQPILRANGFAPPAFPRASLADPLVLRAVVGTAALLAVVAVFSVAVGALLRHSAATISAVIGLVILPVFVAVALPGPAAKMLMLMTPTGGLAIQRVKQPTGGMVEPWSMIGPWAGFGVLCLYAGAAMAAALWLVRRRDA